MNTYLMNFTFPFLRNFLCSLLLVCSLSPLSAQITVSADRPSATYQIKEMIPFLVESNSDGAATYWIRKDRYSAIIESGTINLEAGVPQTIFYQATVPGVILCTVAQNNNSATAGAAVAPFEITALEKAPSDLSTYWNNALTELAAIPIDPQLSFEEEKEYTSTYKINLATIANRRVYGYLTLPKGDGPFPAIITFPPFGSGANLTGTSNSLAERGGAISLSLSIHNVDPEEEDPNAYVPDVITNVDSLYYRLAILAGVRAIDYIFTRNDFDGESLGVNGVSQGGGLATIIAGLDPRVKLLVFSNSALCQHNGLKYDQASGFPYYLNESRTISGTEAHQALTVAATKYIDAVYFAKRFTGPVLGLTGYVDTICPSSTVFAAFNQFRGPKVLVHAKEVGHNHPSEYWNGRMDFYRRHFPAMQSPPWPWPGTDQGYFANAGADQTTSVGNSINLNATVDYNNELNTSWKVEWQVEEGTGNVSFSNPNSHTSNATFDTPGTYILRFTAYNDDEINSDEPRLFTITDYVKITVN